MFLGGGCHADVGLVKVWFFSFLVPEMARGVSDFLPKASDRSAVDTCPLLKSETVIHVLGVLHACHSPWAVRNSASCFMQVREGGRASGLCFVGKAFI